MVARGDVAQRDLDALAEAVAPDRADIVAVPGIGISSSMIRERIAAGRPVGHLLPPEVAQALVEEGLVPSPASSRRKPKKARSPRRSI